MRLREVETAAILAGGLGTRLRSVVPDLPKPMAPVEGRPFLAWQMDYWMEQGVRRFILSVGYRRDTIVAHFGSSYRGTTVDYVMEEKPLGTGGGFLLAHNLAPKDVPLLVLNGDTFFDVDLQELCRLHGENGADWTLGLFRTDDADRYMGVEVGDDGRILSLEPVRQGPRLANGGVYLINPQAVSMSRWRPGDNASLERDIMPDLLGAGRRFFGYPCDGRFIDIGIPDDYRRAAGVLSVQERHERN